MQNREGNSAVEMTRPTGAARNHKVNCQCGFCGRLKANQEIASAKERRGQKARRRQLTPKQRRWVQEFSSEGSPGFKNATKSAVMAGYSSESADVTGSKLLRSEQVQRSVTRSLEGQGITSNFLFAGLREGLRAEEIKYVTKEGRFTDERRVPDWHARAKYQEMAHRLRGDMPQKEQGVQNAALIIRLPAEAKAEDSERYLEAYFSQQSKGEPE